MTSSSERHIVLGMAGHIDHGKTELVKALTGTDTDRLKEEKERGMTTDLGFAFLSESLTIIDVPGHEKFVKTMVAGVTTVDLALLVIAADDGVMPQTVEHLDILNLLQIPKGIVAISKVDLVDKDWLAMVHEDVRKLVRGSVLQDAPVLSVSPITGEGIDDLKTSILKEAEKVQQRRDTGIFRMSVDRVFSIKGFGTIVAGTTLSGQVSAEDTVELLPRQQVLRVRGVQVHGKKVQQGSVGFRTAINLMNVEKQAITRGNVLASPGFYKPTQMMDAHFSLLKSWPKKLKNRSRVRVHIGTDEAIARMVLLDKKEYQPGDQGFVQLHFEKPVVVQSGDRFVIRHYSPVRTIGGGNILDAHPKKHKPFDPLCINRLEKRQSGGDSQTILDYLESLYFYPIQTETLAKNIGMQKETLGQILSELEETGEILRMGKKRFITTRNWDNLQFQIKRQLDLFHAQNPLKQSASSATIQKQIKPGVDKILFDTMLDFLSENRQINKSGGRIRSFRHQVNFSDEQETISKRIVESLLKTPVKPPDRTALEKEFGPNAGPILEYLVETGVVVFITENLYFHTEALRQIESSIRTMLQKSGKATVSEFREYLDSTRKYVLPLLNYFDDLGLTIREGDIRRLRE